MVQKNQDVPFVWSMVTGLKTEIFEVYASHMKMLLLAVVKATQTIL